MAFVLVGVAQAESVSWLAPLALVLVLLGVRLPFVGARLEDETLMLRNVLRTRRIDRREVVQRSSGLGWFRVAVRLHLESGASVTVSALSTDAGRAAVETALAGLGLDGVPERRRV